MSIIIRAAALAEFYHRDQERKNNKLPYLTHLIRVAGRVATHPGAFEAQVAAAFLHDVVEDQATTPERLVTIQEQIISECGESTLDLVTRLTNRSVQLKSKLPRKERKLMDREWLALQPNEVKVIKLIDRIDNVNESSNDLLIGLDSDLKFNLLYSDESQELLEKALFDSSKKLITELEEAIKRLRKICNDKMVNWALRHENDL